MALRSAAVFLLIATLAAFYGFTSNAGAITQLLQVLFVVFVVLFVVSTIFGYPIQKQKS